MMFVCMLRGVWGVSVIITVTTREWVHGIPPEVIYGGFKNNSYVETSITTGLLFLSLFIFSVSKARLCLAWHGLSMLTWRIVEVWTMKSLIFLFVLSCLPAWRETDDVSSWKERLNGTGSVSSHIHAQGKRPIMYDYIGVQERKEQRGKERVGWKQPPLVYFPSFVLTQAIRRGRRESERNHHSRFSQPAISFTVSIHPLGTP